MMAPNRREGQRGRRRQRLSDEPLDQLNRFVIVVGALAIVFVALLVALLAWGAPDGTIDADRATSRAICGATTTARRR